MSVFKKFKKFLGKHSDEMAAVSSAIRVIGHALPVEPSEKRAILSAADVLSDASKNIVASIKNVKEMADELPTPKEVFEAGKKDFDGMIRDAVAAAFTEYMRAQQQDAVNKAVAEALKQAGQNK